MAKPAKRIKSAAAAYVPQNRDAVITDIKRIGIYSAKHHVWKRK
ncbi:phage host-nuclease inhibitor protein Gam [Escherichia coli]|nr:phage host-nuclease inhibitor protein Gam [Escherichia coli]